MSAAKVVKRFVSFILNGFGGDREGFLLMIEGLSEWVDCCFFIVLGRGGKGGWSF